ncbi:hypothetical protein BH20ACT14_BH20ACT14_13850 [soil metagenome]
MLSETGRTIPCIPTTQANREVTETSNGLSAEYPRGTPFVAVICFWVASLLASWVLVGFVVAGIWWLFI